ncbi:hypothetical protein [Methylocystis parvus]|uniref:Uncharacterized protein n=1 Tax=Methylocystis parvus TaxID=134 RepID=A0A6B8M2S9_9HYPH|nr:hypothetical protein [Methylocystis parvus]QGM96668.1 hypothetical protein F7D14_03670 [Methylocystis parvus]WBJ99470.1 hypothetical protein MMG94_15965 [Methylocystis parvus OBBP]
MQGKDALALLNFSDDEFIAAAGPAVLRLKLIEANHLAESRRLPEDMRQAARRAAIELRALIAERPCVSLIDHAAKRSLEDMRPSGGTACSVSAVAGQA